MSAWILIKDCLLEIPDDKNITTSLPHKKKKKANNKQLKRDKYLIWLSNLGPFIQHLQDYREFAK